MSFIIQHLLFFFILGNKRINTLAYTVTSLQYEEVLNKFKELDVNNDGFLSMEEITPYYVELAGVDEGTAEKQLSEFIDTNADGQINYLEFLQFKLS